MLILQPFRIVALTIAALALVTSQSGRQLSAADKPAAKTDSGAAKKSPAEALSPEQWKLLDRTVDNGLKYLAAQQEPDGSFECPDVAQPAMTSFAVLAFLSRGHLPDQGPYGKQIHKAIDFVLAQQQPNGMIFAQAPTTSSPLNNRLVAGRRPGPPAARRRSARSARN